MLFRSISAWKESLYIYLLQKREENELSKTYTAWNTRIIQPPTGSNMPNSASRTAAPYVFTWLRNI